MKISMLAILTAISHATAMTVPAPNDNSSATLIEARIVGNEASVLLCDQPFTGNQGVSGKCGIFATYTNGQTRQSVSYQTGGQNLCAFEELQKHTNSAGFWVDINIFGSSKGANIGYNPTGKSISLGTATSSSSDQAYLNGRCLNEFGWSGVNTDTSSEAFFANLGTKLY